MGHPPTMSAMPPALARCWETDRSRAVGPLPLIAGRFRELVPNPVHRKDKARLAWVRLDFAAQVLDVGVYRAVKALERLVVHQINQLSAGKGPSRVAGQRRQQVELGRGQVNE